MSKIIFLGQLKDQAGAEETDIDLSTAVTLDGVIILIAQDDPELTKALTAPSVRVIVNKSVLVSGQVLPKQIDEIAFLPPLSGG